MINPFKPGTLEEIVMINGDIMFRILLIQLLHQRRTSLWLEIKFKNRHEVKEKEEKEKEKEKERSGWVFGVIFSCYLFSRA
jgi:hypothetical protein